MQERTYEIERNAPSPMLWNEYEELLKSAWRAFIDDDPPPDEAKVQKFLEEHVALLPTPYGHHSPLHSAIFSQPVLPGIRELFPDFMTLEKDSLQITAHLIEIESPTKKWATKSAGTSAQLTQARDQMDNWRVWFNEPGNMDSFCELYRTPHTEGTLVQRYSLVYGRRDEATSNRSFAKRRSEMQKNDESLMTYDRLTPNKNLEQCITVRIKRESSGVTYDAIAIPPTLRLGPHMAVEWAKLSSRENAISRNRYLSDDRKDFLIDRTAYWDEWSRSTSGFTRITPDALE